MKNAVNGAGDDGNLLELVRLRAPGIVMEDPNVRATSRDDESIRVRPQQTTDATGEEASPFPGLLAADVDSNTNPHEVLPKSWAEILQGAQPQPLPRTQASTRRRRPHEGIPGAHAIQSVVPWGDSRAGNIHPIHLDHDSTTTESVHLVDGPTTTTTTSQEQIRQQEPLHHGQVVEQQQQEEESEEPDNQHLLASENQMSSVVSNKTLRRQLLCALSLEVNVAFLTVIVVLLVFLGASKGENGSSQNPSWSNAIPLATAEAVTLVPSQAPTTLLDALNLPKYTIESLEQQRSPQAKAYHWLISNMHNNSSHSNGTTNLPVQKILPAWRLRQRFALRTFYYSTQGDHWVKKHGWMDWETNECLWEQISMDADSDNYYCNTKGEINMLAFETSNNLRGTIPNEISLLGKSLQSLGVSTVR